MKTKPKTKAATMAMRIHFSWLNRSRMTLSMENYLSDVSSRASDQKSGRESGSMDSKRTAQSTYSTADLKFAPVLGSGRWALGSWLLGFACHEPPKSPEP